MTEEQATKIIELLERIDKRLESVIAGDSQVDVFVQNESITVDTQADHPIEVYESRR